MSWFIAPQPLLPEVFALYGRWRAPQPAWICDDEIVTWAEFVARTHQVANGLHALGIAKGDRVGVMMHNSGEMLEAMMGIITAGAVAVPLNLSVNDAAAVAMLKDAGARAVFASGDQCTRLDALRDQLPDIEPKAWIGLDAGKDWQAYATFRDGAERKPPAVTLSPEDGCNIIYSSGTTGLPKGIVHSHGCRLAWAQDLSLALRYDSGAVTLCTLGMYSNITWVTFLNTLYNGGTVVVARRFDAAESLALVERHGITHFAMVPVQYQRILAVPTIDDFKLGTLRGLMCCGSPLPPVYKEAIIRRFGATFIELYGLTEGLITVLDPEDAQRKLSSVGRPIVATDIRIVGDDDKPVATGEVGEIVGISRVVMSGYHEREQASDEATWTGPDGRRWLRTGDVGKVDDEGFLYLVDRKKDMIISGGQNVYPADIEAVVAEHPQVIEVAVVGVPSEKWGETPLAVIVGREGADTSAILQWANAKLGKQQRLAAAVLRDSLPRNPNGKVLKRELRDEYRNRVALT